MRWSAAMLAALQWLSTPHTRIAPANYRGWVLRGCVRPLQANGTTAQKALVLLHKRSYTYTWMSLIIEFECLVHPGLFHILPLKQGMNGEVSQERRVWLTTLQIEQGSSSGTIACFVSLAMGSL